MSVFKKLSFFLLFTSHLVSFETARFYEARHHEVDTLSFENEGTWKGPFTFVIFADPQFGFFNQDISWEQEIELLEKAIVTINQLKPKFVLTCGDMTNARPNEPAYSKQLSDFKEVMNKIDPSIPLLFVCGNHDVGNHPTDSDLVLYQNQYGDDYYKFWVSGVEFFVINSCRYSNSKDAKSQILEQNSWLERNLLGDQKKESVHKALFAHHQWFHDDPWEKGNYFVLPKEHRIPLLEIISKGNINACFSGHYHRNHFQHFNGIDFVTVNAVGRPLGEDPSGFLIVDVKDDKISHQFVPVN